MRRRQASDGDGQDGGGEVGLHHHPRLYSFHGRTGLEQITYQPRVEGLELLHHARVLQPQPPQPQPAKGPYHDRPRPPLLAQPDRGEPPAPSRRSWNVPPWQEDSAGAARLIVDRHGWMVEEERELRRWIIDGYV